MALLNLPENGWCKYPALETLQPLLTEQVYPIVFKNVKNKPFYKQKVLVTGKKYYQQTPVNIL